jgi:Zn-dependent metalloprotease
MFSTYCPIQCIIPPHMMRHVLEKGTPPMRQRALRALTMSSRLRGRRDALAGLTFRVAAPGKHRTIYDAKHTTNLPGTMVRQEGDDPVADTSVNEAYDGLGATYDFYYEVYQRDSLNDRGYPLDGVVHFDVDYDNAFFDGQRMVFGDGDGVLFVGFTKALDVIAHELTHGVTSFEANLDYQDQSGALNESFSDVFGSLVKQHALGQDVNAADWLIGQGILGPDINGIALRSMKAPGTAYNDPQLGKDPQPANMRDYVNTTDDNGGVHINSGIPNHAFFLVAMELGGDAWEQAGQIWYDALRTLKHDADFQTAADVTFQVAGNRYGAGSPQQQAVRNGWAGVGIKVAGARPARRPAARVAAAATEADGGQVAALAEEVRRLSRIVEALGEKIATTEPEVAKVGRSTR